MNLRSVLITLPAILILACMLGCPAPQAGGKPAETPSAVPAESQGESEKIILATTTSVDNTGLLGYLLPVFRGETGIEVDAVAVGTGAALQLARDGNADIVLVHDREAEEQFIAEGHGLSRHYVAQNEFVIIGPEDDQADASSAETAADAFAKIMETESRFVSRGDNSGTHMRELSIWERAGLEPGGEWYVEAGQGMGAATTVANEMGAYTLIDTGTFYSMEDSIDLVMLFSGDPILVNVYSIIPLNPEMHPDLHLEEAQRFMEWLTSPETGELIEGFKVNGHTLFHVDVNGYSGIESDREE
jgi:tungstate transport system substrate-binding protein